MIEHATIDALRVTPGKPAALATRNTAGIGDRKDSTTLGDEKADAELEGFTNELAAAQERLYVAGSNALLVVLQGLDAAGKDGTIKHVMSGVNPQGCEVVSFKEPSAEELAHDFLWRAAKATPERGRIGIFNRSHYEEVVVVRVHPALLQAQHLGADATPTAGLWQKRYDDINAFEQHLDRNGTRIVKFFLHLSRDQQRKRLLERLDNPAKHWKFAPSDLAERGYWEDYQVAYEDAITATSTPWAPWYVIPADRKHLMRALVAGILVATIDQLHLSVPAVSPATLRQIDTARATLLAE